MTCAAGTRRQSFWMLRCGDLEGPGGLARCAKFNCPALATGFNQPYQRDFSRFISSAPRRRTCEKLILMKFKLLTRLGERIETQRAWNVNQTVGNEWAKRSVRGRPFRCFMDVTSVRYRSRTGPLRSAQSCTIRLQPGRCMCRGCDPHSPMLRVAQAVTLSPVTSGHEGPGAGESGALWAKLK